MRSGRSFYMEAGGSLSAVPLHAVYVFILNVTSTSELLPQRRTPSLGLLLHSQSIDTRVGFDAHG